MAFRHVIADSDGKLRRNLGKSIVTPSTEIVVPSPSIFRKGLGQSSPVESIQYVEAPKTSLIRKGLGKIKESASVGSGVLFEDKCESATLPDGVVTSGVIVYSSGRYWTINGDYLIPLTGVLSDNPCLFCNFLNFSTLGQFRVRIFINGTVQYIFNMQPDQNVVLYRMPSVAIAWNPGFFNQANENWKLEIALSQTNIHARIWRDTNSEVYFSPSLAHSHFSANAGDSIQFELFCTVAGGQSSKLKYARVDTKPLQWAY